MTVSRSVVPGEWYAVLGDDVVVLLPPAAKARVAGVWELVDEGAGFDEVLDGLISGGLRELPGFVLVSESDGDVKLVIRGAGVAELTAAEGPVTISGDADSTWVERTVTGVTGLCLRVADGDEPSYTLGSGLVRVSSVEQPATGGRADTGPIAVASAELTPAPEPVPEPVRPFPSRSPNRSRSRSPSPFLPVGAWRRRAGRRGPWRASSSPAARPSTWTGPWWSAGRHSPAASVTSRPC